MRIAFVISLVTVDHAAQGTFVTVQTTVLPAHCVLLRTILTLVCCCRATGLVRQLHALGLAPAAFVLVLPTQRTLCQRRRQCCLSTPRLLFDSLKCLALARQAARLCRGWISLLSEDTTQRVQCTRATAALYCQLASTGGRSLTRTEGTVSTVSLCRRRLSSRSCWQKPHSLLACTLPEGKMESACACLSFMLCRLACSRSSVTLLLLAFMTFRSLGMTLHKFLFIASFRRRAKVRFISNLFMFMVGVRHHSIVLADKRHLHRHRSQFRRRRIQQRNRHRVQQRNRHRVQQRNRHHNRHRSRLRRRFQHRRQLRRKPRRRRKRQPTQALRRKIARTSVRRALALEFLDLAVLCTTTSPVPELGAAACSTVKTSSVSMMLLAVKLGATTQPAVEAALATASSRTIVAHRAHV
jgi:hypothetical protein